MFIYKIQFYIKLLGPTGPGLIYLDSVTYYRVITPARIWKKGIDYTGR